MYKFNKQIFDEIDTENKAYWLGFLIGDGSIHKGHLKLELSNKDKDHLFKYKSFMSADNPIIESKKDCSYISLNNTVFVKSLIKYGLVPGKTYTHITTPILDEKFLSHFYLGLLDSDGWITEHKLKNVRPSYEFGFSSYYQDILLEIKNWFCKLLNKQCGYLITRYKENQQVSQLIIGGRKNFINIYNIFYKNINQFDCLTRKYNIATNFYNIINSEPDKRSREYRLTIGRS